MRAFGPGGHIGDVRTEAAEATQVGNLVAFWPGDILDKLHSCASWLPRGAVGSSGGLLIEPPGLAGWLPAASA